MMQRALGNVTVSLFLLSCSPTVEVPVRIIGHGGLGEGADQPMNSAAALRGGLEAGLDGVELDVQLSADGVLVAYHAQELNELTACHGLVNATAWPTLRTCTVEGDNGAAHPVVRVDSLLPILARAFPETDFTLDAKLFSAGDWWAYLETFSRAIADLHALPELRGRLVLECQVTDFLDLVARDAPGLPLYLYTTDAAQAIPTAVEKGYAGITIRYDRIAPADVQHARQRGLLVTLFGAGGRWSHHKALSAAPDRLQSDDPLALDQ
jgi:glycerophosphoryl diester phosphodiesterase